MPPGGPGRGAVKGETMKKCGKRTEVYSRVTGYFRPVRNWNAGKQEEFRNRRPFAAQAETPAEPELAHDDACVCS